MYIKNKFCIKMTFSIMNAGSTVSIFRRGVFAGEQNPDPKAGTNNSGELADKLCLEQSSMSLRLLLSHQQYLQFC